MLASRHMIVVGLCLIAGTIAGVVVWWVPAIWLPVDAAIAVTGLALALYGLTRDRRRS
ncbi:hypothetical protein ACSNOI_23995 [Actinomadura kijaniata]|uniref:hypothetical protein n=1 Tax=Actinomadura kijaniata TaxID=46161 RepID=UPI003F1D9E8A